MAQSLTSKIGESVTAVRDIFANPENQKLPNDNDLQNDIYLKNWMFYTNEAFEKLDQWRNYMQVKGLYQYTRQIYNPFRRQVDFYVGKVYPGRLKLEGEDENPNESNSAMPFSDDMDSAVIKGIQQLWEWSNWQTNQKLMIRYAAVAGKCLVEWVDDLEGGKVRPSIVWAGLMRHDKTILDDFGNLKQYAIEYYIETEEDGRFLFRKEVTSKSIKFFKDGQPYNYNELGTEIPNPYGFCPAVLVKHTDMGGDSAEGAFRGNYAKMDELNSLATHFLDLAHKKSDPPIILWTSDRLTKAFKTPRKGVDADGSRATDDVDVRSTNLILKGSEKGKKEELVGRMMFEDGYPLIENLVKEIEKDLPELTFYEKMREMQEVTGPGIKGLLGDVEAFFDDASSNYDHANKTIWQMGLSIAGMRRQDRIGGWVDDNDQQKKFAPFDLKSYEKGDLHVHILPRPLFVETESDRVRMFGEKLDNANKADGILPKRKQLEIIDITDKEEQDAILAELSKEIGTFEGNEEGNLDFGRDVI